MCAHFMGASYICSSEEEYHNHSCNAGRLNLSEANLPLHSQSLGTQAAHLVSYRPSSGPMLNVGSCNNDCSLRMWNVRRTMAPEDWDLQRKIECACGTGWEQDMSKITHGAMGWTWELVWRPDWIKYWIMYWIHTYVTHLKQSSHCAGLTFGEYKVPHRHHIRN
jgi:hypothetical protein